MAGIGIEAVSSQEAAALAISELPLFSDVQLIYVVPDDLDGIEVFWPTADPSPLNATRYRVQIRSSAYSS